MRMQPTTASGVNSRIDVSNITYLVIPTGAVIANVGKVKNKNITIIIGTYVHLKWTPTFMQISSNKMGFNNICLNAECAM